MSVDESNADVDGARESGWQSVDGQQLVDIPSVTAHDIAAVVDNHSILESYVKQSIVVPAVRRGLVSVSIAQGLFYFEESVEPSRLTVSDLSVESRTDGYRGSVVASYRETIPMQFTAADPRAQSLDCNVEFRGSFHSSLGGTTLNATVTVAPLTEGEL